jgi:hypothetical protein
VISAPRFERSIVYGRPCVLSPRFRRGGIQTS